MQRSSKWVIQPRECELAMGVWIQGRTSQAIDIQIKNFKTGNSTRITRMLRINTDRVSVLNP